MEEVGRRGERGKEGKGKGGEKSGLVVGMVNEMGRKNEGRRGKV